jgi:hypothetical protein
MARPKKTITPIVQPLVKVAGDKHIFETFEEEDKLPTLKAVGLVKVHENSRDYVSFTIHTKGDKIVKLEVSEPNLRSIAIEQAKIEFVNGFMNDEGL